jgi:hypothetical protein
MSLIGFLIGPLTGLSTGLSTRLLVERVFLLSMSGSYSILDRIGRGATLLPAMRGTSRFPVMPPSLRFLVRTIVNSS